MALLVSLATGGGLHPFPCGVKAVLDLPCPGCGTTHALASLGRGEMLAAFLANPLAAAGAFGLAVWALFSRQLGSVALPRPGVAACLLLVTANWLYLWLWKPSILP